MRPFCFLTLLAALLSPAAESLGSPETTPAKTVGVVLHARPDTSVAKSQTTTSDESIPGVFVLRLRDGLRPAKNGASTGILSIDKRLAPYGVVDITPVLNERLLGKRSLDTSALEGIYRVEYSVGVPPEEVTRLLQGNPEIVYAEPLYRHRISAVPDDESFESMAQFARVEAEAAWDVVKGSQGSVVIGIVDGGTDWRHPDLLANVWSNPTEIPANGLDDDENGYVDDVNGWNFALNVPDPTGLPQHPGNSSHGTHVAGIAAAVTDNGMGVASLSWNASFMPINAGSDLVDDQIAYGYDGIMYAAANGADIINCSWGRHGGGSIFEQDVIDFAFDNGALVVAAAGNESSNTDLDPHFPSNYPKVLGVGATNSGTDAIGSFSNYGIEVDVFAPGVQILSTVPNEGYSPSFSGTSMASPMVAGLAALIKTLSIDFSVDELREQIRITSDLIDNDNPGRSGLLGHGRINARRAVTEFTHPSVRITGSTVVESNPDGVISPGETVDVEIAFINYLATAPALSVELSTNDPYAEVLVSQQNLPILGSGETGSATFRIRITNDVPIHYHAHFYADLSGTDYSDRDVISVLANPSRTEDLDTGKLQTSVTTEGNIGALGFAGQTSGVGFVYQGDNYLFEGGLMLGTGELTVSDCIRGMDSIQDQDFRPSLGTDLVVISPGMRATQESTITLVDSLAARPLGVSILQETFADSSPENQDFVIFRYSITNDSPTTLENLHVGLFFDWDVSSNSVDNSGYDADRRMGYVTERAPFGEEPTKIAATRLLTSSASPSYKAVDNAADLFDDKGFTPAEKWSFLSGGIQTESLTGRDISQLTSEGPFSIEPGSRIEVAFAVIGATSLAELEAHADQAKLFFDSLPTASEPVPMPIFNATRLEPLFPNPFHQTTEIPYWVENPERVELVVFDLLGRRIATLVDDVKTPGSHTAVWDPSRTGFDLASGLYFIRLQTRDGAQTRSVVFHR